MFLLGFKSDFNCGRNGKWEAPLDFVHTWPKDTPQHRNTRAVCQQQTSWPSYKKDTKDAGQSPSKAYLRHLEGL